MASARDIRRRIKSVKNTAQITKAMQLVAASKMKKAQDQALASRPYAKLLNEVLVNLRDQTEEGSHPLLVEREGDRELLIVISTDKGLCGGLNTNLLRQLTREMTPGSSFVTIGRKGRVALTKMQKELVADFHVKDPVSFAETKQIGRFIIDQFLNGDFARVRVAFTNFVNTMTQVAMIETLLPVRRLDLGKKKDFIGMGNEPAPSANHNGSGPGPAGYLFEPDAATVLETVVPQYVNYLLYQMLLESRASEHSARMVAMKSATDNAKELIKDLTLAYNKQRQAAITSELLEITTAMKALE
jgi:F-type H+-transporting ATPase subunit gamma